MSGQKRTYSITCKPVYLHNTIITNIERIIILGYSKTIFSDTRELNIKYHIMERTRNHAIETTFFIPKELMLDIPTLDDISMIVKYAISIMGLLNIDILLCIKPRYWANSIHIIVREIYVTICNPSLALTSKVNLLDMLATIILLKTAINNKNTDIFNQTTCIDMANNNG